MTEFVKISTLVLAQQQQLGSLLLSSRSTFRLAAVAVRLVIPLLYSLKRFDAEGPLLLRPILANAVGGHRCSGQTCGGRKAVKQVRKGIFWRDLAATTRAAANTARPGGAVITRVVHGDWAAPWRASRRRHDSESQEHLVIWRPS